MTIAVPNWVFLASVLYAAIGAYVLGSSGWPPLWPFPVKVRVYGGRLRFSAAAVVNCMVITLAWPLPLAWGFLRGLLQMKFLRLLNRYDLIFVVCVIVALTLISATADAATVTLNWTPPTARSDNTPLPPSEIANYGVFWSQADIGPFTLREEAAGGANRTHQVLNVPPGRRCFRLRTRDTATPVRESLDSNFVCVDVPVAPPKSPTAISITVTVELLSPTP